MRLGVPLTPLKARLFDAVSRAGPDGISGDDLFTIVFSERRASRMSGLKSHVWQINTAIALAGWRIDGRGGFFRLRRMGREQKHGEIFLGMART